MRRISVSKKQFITTCSALAWAISAALTACSPISLSDPIPTATMPIQAPDATLTSSPTLSPSPILTPTSTASNTPEPTATASPKPSTATPTAEPFPEQCGKVEIGETGSQTQVNPEAIVMQGTAILCGAVYLSANMFWPIPVPEGQIDLDTGRTGFLEGADLEFFVSGGTDIFNYLYAINDAISVPWSIALIDDAYVDPPEPSFEDCRDFVNIYANDNEPWFVCVMTDFGNVARVKLEEYNPLGTAVLAVEISFITWRPE